MGNSQPAWQSDDGYDEGKREGYCNRMAPREDPFIQRKNKIETEKKDERSKNGEKIAQQ